MGSNPIDATMNIKDEVRKIAHRIWLEEDQPDGEALVPWAGGMIKLKELHWRRAEVEYIYGPGYTRSW